MLKTFEVQRFSVYLTEDYGLLKFIWKASWAILMNKLFRITVKPLELSSMNVNPSVFNDHRFFCITGSPESGILTEKNSEGWHMNRLNLGIFRIFELSTWNLNPNSSDWRAYKIIYNYTKLGPISWELNLKNQILNFCVGVWVGGHDATNFSYIKMRNKILHLLILILRALLPTDKSYGQKTAPKMELAWVELKSNKTVGFISSICWKCQKLSWEKTIKVIIRIEHIGLVWILKFRNPTRSKIFVKFGIEVIKKMTRCKKEVVCTCSL